MSFDWIISGIVLGGLYAIMSSGLTLIWGTVGILNFAHGAFITWSGYVIWYALSELNMNFAVSACLAVMFTFFLGVVVELAIFRLLRMKPNAAMNSIYASLGMAIALENIIIVMFGPRRKAIPPTIEGYALIGGVAISYHKVVIIFVALLSLTVFTLFLKKSKYGMAMRAVAQNLTDSQLMGIDINMIYLLTVGSGSAMAGIAGIFLSSIYFLWPTFGDIPLIKAFIIIVFGGLGSIKGTICASFILGIVEALAGLYFGLGWALPAMFVFMLVTLIVRPSGLFGLEVRG